MASAEEGTAARISAVSPSRPPGTSVGVVKYSKQRRAASAACIDAARRVAAATTGSG
ncbi:MAG: hypothetical protein HYY85_20065 [Deltaproteobacteria bacterium]|nr:hypothetical protein [Deltaproteobacteria bacterium]